MLSLCHHRFHVHAQKMVSSRKGNLFPNRCIVTHACGQMDIEKHRKAFCDNVFFCCWVGIKCRSLFRWCIYVLMSKSILSFFIRRLIWFVDTYFLCSWFSSTIFLLRYIFYKKCSIGKRIFYSFNRQKFHDIFWWKNLVQFWLKKDTVQALNVSLSLFTFPIWEMSFEKVANNSTTTTTTAAVTTSTPSEWVKGLNLSLTHTHFHLSYLTMFIAANPRDDKLQKHHIEKFSLWEY